MTSPNDNTLNNLWPIPAAMHQYLDNWEQYAAELQRRLDVQRASSAATEAALAEKIGSLRQEMVDNERPLLEQISSLEQTRLTLQLDNDTLRKEMNTAVDLLHAALDNTGKRLPLQTLINDAVLLIEEAKKQIRESL